MPTPFILDPYYNNFQPQSQMTPFKAKTIGYIGNPVPWQLWGLALFYIFMGALMTLGIGYWLFREYQFHQSGHDLMVTVGSCEMVSGPKVAIPELAYTYTIAGKTYPSRSSLQSKQGHCSDYPIGMELKARYLDTISPEVVVTDERVAQTTAEKIGVMVIAIPVMLFCDAGAVLLTLSIIYHPINKRRYERLLKHGLLLEGEIVQIRGHRKSGYFVTVRYRFCVPDDRVLWGKQSHEREDLRKQELPPPGTPVKVYYADQHAYVML
ncbi:MAG TPA: hypothetical protein VHO69_03000 [Phototrophicaceae bacterium]|nr:hypothetical protein [Phototrophicaceae bacterium]